MWDSDIVCAGPARAACIARCAQRAGRDPLVPRCMRDHLSELAMLGLVSVSERNEGRRGGTYREYTLELEVELILSALNEVITDVGIHDSLKNHLPDSEADLVTSLMEFQ